MTNNLFIKDITIENYKQFKKVIVSDFGQINLITGKNNSGKSTLLEALYLNLGPTNPTLWLRINASRGLERVSPKQSHVPDLFHKNDTSQNIKFTVNSRHHSKYTLEISLREPTLKETSSIGSLPRIPEQDSKEVESLPGSHITDIKVVENIFTPKNSKSKKNIVKSIYSPCKYQY